MKITVFTSNQPRHLSLINDLAKIADTVYAIIEVNTVFPGKINDFYKGSQVMMDYFSKVIEAEKKIFGTIRFLPNNVRPLIIKSGDLNFLSTELLDAALHSDKYVVFGSSYIKGDLINFLVQEKAINIHMGVSPYYRGSSCNFWALKDGNIALVGATIHMLSKGLDSGSILFHCLPSVANNGFDLGMMAVKSAHAGLIQYFRNADLKKEYATLKQNKLEEIKYTKNSDFTDDVALNYLLNMPDKKAIQEAIMNRNSIKYIKPFFLED